MDCFSIRTQVFPGANSFPRWDGVVYFTVQGVVPLKIIIHFKIYIIYIDVWESMGGDDLWELSLPSLFSSALRILHRRNFFQKLDMLFIFLKDSF